MYLRFAVEEVHKHSHRRLGVFHALAQLRDAKKLNSYEEEHFRVVSKWFSVHLDTPTRFTAAKPPYGRKKRKAISWFRDSAQEHIDRIREIVAILENHGVSVRMLKTDRVGYVVYEDEHQVVAEPFSDAQF
jgi:hypothetical protein